MSTRCEHISGDSSRQAPLSTVCAHKASTMITNIRSVKACVRTRCEYTTQV